MLSKYSYERINAIFAPIYSHFPLLPPSPRAREPTPLTPYPEPFDRILQVLAAADHYAIGDFLVDLFRVAGRSERHGKMLGAFLRGNTMYGVGEVLERLDVVAGQVETPREYLYMITTPYKSLKSSHAALTSYAAQKFRDRLSAEQYAAVDPDSGLHAFAPRKKTEPIKLHLSWDTYGATTFEGVQAILTKHQPPTRTFHLIQHLANPEHYDLGTEYCYRPPSFVCGI